MHSAQTTRKGSALLIVLGLISFLLISAVAFSISMRTESSAAAAYRRSLLARELLATAFADARITLDHAMTSQRNLASPQFQADDPSTHTVEALAPFKHTGADKYGRLIASRTSEDDVSVAGLLDDKVMRHVPPYIAATVYDVLESGEGDYDPASTPIYNINDRAEWLPIYASIPENRAAQGNSNYIVDETVVGRMAWAVINLSDSLDINAIGSNSAYRGLGFTGSEFAFGTMETNPSETLDPWFLKNEDPQNAPVDLPTFCSNADLAQYAAQHASSPDLLLTDGDFAPFSWENAIATLDDGFYSPFSVYSFWPNAERKDEAGNRIQLQSSSGGATVDPGERVACNTVTEQSISTADDTLSRSINDLVQRVLQTSGAESVGENFVRMLLDYVDEDSVPSEFNRDPLTAFAQPTVENTAMVAEVGFDHTGWNKTAYPKEVSEAIKKSIEDLPIFKNSGKAYDSYASIPTELDVDSIELQLTAPKQTVAYRAYFPGGEESEDSYTIEVDPKNTIVSILAAGEVDGGSPFTFEGDSVAEKIKNASFSIDVSSTAGELFTSSQMLTMEANQAPKFKFEGKHFYVAKPAEDETEVTEENAKKIRLTFLVDFLFRVQVSNKSGDVVDMAPANEAVFGEQTAEKFPKTVAERLEAARMARIDAQYFRVTRPVAVEFALAWKIEKQEVEGQPTKFIATLQWVNGLEPAMPDENLNAEFKFSGTTFKGIDQAPNSLFALSPEKGVWYTIDPRYNWLSPMLGVSDGDFSAYGNNSGGGTPQPKMSSPHWLFLDGENITTGSNPSSLQDAYAELHQDVVPFKWGLKVEDIRYGYNDTGLMLLPYEVGFLPIPLNSNILTPTQTNYCTMSLSNYHNEVAKPSFFRSLPITNLKDSVYSDEIYDRYAKLSTIFKGLEGQFFPEEHRGIVNVFAGQDNYLLAQRLRQFAMLGIPSSIKQAAYVTRERLKNAINAKRIAPEMLTTDLQALNGLNLLNGLKPPKYDDFIREYLFPLPNDDSPSARDTARNWNGNHPLYGSVQGTPTRPETLDFIMEEDGTTSFADRLRAYNQDANASANSGPLGQNDMTTLLALSKECFGDRQQLFLFILRADAIRFNANQALSQHVPLSTARAVALVWRDAYGLLPDRVIYYQYIP